MHRGRWPKTNSTNGEKRSPSSVLPPTTTHNNKPAHGGEGGGGGVDGLGHGRCTRTIWASATSRHSSWRQIWRPSRAASSRNLVNAAMPPQPSAEDQKIGRINTAIKTQLDMIKFYTDTGMETHRLWSLISLISRRSSRKSISRCSIIRRLPPLHFHFHTIHDTSWFGTTFISKQYLHSKQ